MNAVDTTCRRAHGPHRVVAVNAVARNARDELTLTTVGAGLRRGSRDSVALTTRWFA